MFQATPEAGRAVERGKVDLVGRILFNEGFDSYNRSIMTSVVCVLPNNTMNIITVPDMSLPAPFLLFPVDAEWLGDTGCADPCAHGPFVASSDFPLAVRSLRPMGFVP